MKHINLETFANGAFSAQINRALEEVTKNIQDPNTEPTATRKITVTIGLKPNQGRDFVATGVQTKTSLAPALGAVTAISMGRNILTGEVEAVEVGNQIPGQLAMEIGVEASGSTTESEKAYDPDTGEILGNTSEPRKVVDMRKNA